MCLPEHNRSKSQQRNDICIHLLDSENRIVAWLPVNTKFLFKYGSVKTVYCTPEVENSGNALVIVFQIDRISDDFCAPGVYQWRIKPVIFQEAQENKVDMSEAKEGLLLFLETIAESLIEQMESFKDDN